MTDSVANRWLQPSFLAAAIALVAAPALADAGHGDGRTGTPIGTPADPSGATRTVEVTLGDIFFEPEAIAVKAGETIRFVLNNTGQLLHEFNIGTAAMHEAHQEEMAVMMEHGMLTPTGIDEERMKMDHSGAEGRAMTHDHPNSVLVEPGETKELVWNFAQNSELEFACNIPGHYEAGMVGSIEFGG